MKDKIKLILTLIVWIVIGIASCNSIRDTPSSYELHNKDGSINWEYFDNMQDYFKKHPEKLPK